MARFVVDQIPFFIEIKKGYVRADGKDIDAAFIGYNDRIPFMSIESISSVEFIHDYDALQINFYSKNHEQASMRLCSAVKYIGYRELKYVQNLFNERDPYEQVYARNEHEKEMRSIYIKMLAKNAKQQKLLKAHAASKQEELLLLYKVSRERDMLRIERDQLELQVAELASKLAEMSS